MKHQKPDPKGSKEVKQSEQEEFKAAFSGPYDKEDNYNPLIKSQRLRLTTPTCPPLPEELESKVQEVLASNSGEVVGAWRLEPHSCVIVTWPSGQKHIIPR